MIREIAESTALLHGELQTPGRLEPRCGRRGGGVVLENRFDLKELLKDLGIDS